MKKLIAMLSVITLSAGSTSSLTSCFGEKSTKKHSKKHVNKKEKEEDEEYEEDEKDNEEVIEKMLDKLQNLKFASYLKANKINTIANLISELNVRKEIKAIVKDYDFKITTEEKNDSILVQQTYQFKITIEDSQVGEEEEDKEVSAVFEVIVKEQEVDQNQENNMNLLNEVDQLVEKQLTTYNLIADGIDTYKDIKDKIKTDLIDLTLNKKVILEIDFISSIFTTDEQLIYKNENPFEIKINLILKENNEYSLSKIYNSISIIGFTKEQLEDFKSCTEKYDKDKILLEQLISNEDFKEKLSYLTGIKANRTNTVKDLIDKLKSMDYRSIFDSEELKGYKYGFNPLENTDQLLKADMPVNLTIFVIDETSTSAEPFFKKDFKLRVEAESNTEEFVRIAKRIEKQLAREKYEFNFTEQEELHADGKKTWTDLFNTLAKKDNFKQYFKINNLNNINNDIKLIDFSFSLENTESFTKKDFLFNTKENFITVNLTMSPESKNIDKTKIITNKIKIKTGGLNQEQIDEKEFVRISKSIERQLQKDIIYNLTSFDDLSANGEMTWKQLIDKFTSKSNFKEYFNIKHLTEGDLGLVNFSFKIAEGQIVRDENIVFSSNDHVTFDLTMFPENKNVDKSKALSTSVRVKIGGNSKQKNLELIAEKAITRIKDMLDEYKIITEEWFDKDILYIKNKINNELQIIKSEIPELQEQNSKELYNGIWKIEISNKNSEFSYYTDLFHEQILNWDVNIFFSDLDTNELIYNTDLSFSSKIDWTKYPEQLFNEIINDLDVIENAFKNCEFKVIFFQLLKDVIVNRIPSLADNDVMIDYALPGMYYEEIFKKIGENTINFELLQQDVISTINLTSYWAASSENPIIVKFIKDLKILKTAYPKWTLKINLHKPIEYNQYIWQTELIFNKFSHKYNAIENKDFKAFSQVSFNIFLLSIFNFLEL